MTTLRQIEANRRNSTLSTGPKSTEGKEASRANSLKHGLTGAALVQAPDEAEAVAQRLEQWRDCFVPADEYDLWLIEQAAHFDVRVERCRTHDLALRILAAQRAETCWDEDRRLAAEELGERLARKPGATTGRLRRTRQGCDWMIARWEALAGVLRDGRDWSEAQRLLALDLLGTPAEFRDGGTRLDPLGVEGADLRGIRLSVAESELAALVRHRDGSLSGLDEAEQAAAALGLSADPDRTMLLMMRYEATASRGMLWVLRQLRTRKRTEATADLDLSRPIHAAPPWPAPIAPAPSLAQSFDVDLPRDIPDATPLVHPPSDDAPPRDVTAPVSSVETTPTVTGSSGSSLRFDPDPIVMQALSGISHGGLAGHFKSSASTSAGNRRDRRAHLSRERRG
jgi:hypothetical protein